jgi:hypothetical protein
MVRSIAEILDRWKTATIRRKIIMGSNESNTEHRILWLRLENAAQNSKELLDILTAAM